MIRKKGRRVERKTYKTEQVGRNWVLTVSDQFMPTWYSVKAHLTADIKELRAKGYVLDKNTKRGSAVMLRDN